MAERNPSDEAAARKVASEYAAPSRPAGYDGVQHPMAAAPVHPPELSPADDATATATRAALAAEGRLADAEIAVIVRDGLVTLEGRVPLEFQHGLATACVSAVPGVLVVQNRLTVAQRGPMRHVDDG